MNIRPLKSNRDDFLEQTKKEREKREKERAEIQLKEKQESSSRIIQRFYQTNSLRKKCIESLRNEWDKSIAAFSDSMGSAIVLLKLIGLLRLIRSPKDSTRATLICRTVLTSWNQANPEKNLSCLLLNAEYASKLVRYLDFLLICSLEEVCRVKNIFASSPELRLLIMITDARTWNLWRQASGATESSPAAEKLVTTLEGHAQHFFRTVCEQGMLCKLRATMTQCVVGLAGKSDDCVSMSQSGAKGGDERGKPAIWLDAVTLLALRTLPADPTTKRTTDPATAKLYIEFSQYILTVPLLGNFWGKSCMEILAKQFPVILAALFGVLRDTRGSGNSNGNGNGNGADVAQTIWHWDAERTLYLLGNLAQLFDRLLTWNISEKKGSAIAWKDEEHYHYVMCLVALGRKWEGHLGAEQATSSSSSSSSSSTSVAYHPIFRWRKGTIDPVLSDAAITTALLSQITLLWRTQCLHACFDRHVTRTSVLLSTDLTKKEILPCLLASCDLYLTLTRVVHITSRADIVATLAYHMPCIPAFLWTVIETLSPIPNALSSPSPSSSSSHDPNSSNVSITSGSSTRNSIQNINTSASSSLNSMFSMLSSLASAFRPNWGKVNPLQTVPVPLLQLFCSTSLSLFLVLDDHEVYEAHTPFTLQALASVARKLTLYVFHAVFTDDQGASPSRVPDEVISAATSILRVLHSRHARRPFGPENELWLVRECEGRDFLEGLMQFRPAHVAVLNAIPHAIPFETRLQFLRASINLARGVPEGSSHAPAPGYLLTISRKRIVEDAVMQISKLPLQSLRTTPIKVRFVNELGLSEAGIDQAGVSKEFVEEVTKALFAKDRGLFAHTENTTEGHHVYPSPTSRAAAGSDHLLLLRCAGVVVAKAVCEGFNVDVPFADFFLSKVLGHHNSFDELPSLDPDLYKNLLAVKNYDGDVQDLGLTFSVTNEIFGKIETVNLLPGGPDVTNLSRIQYIHMMAHYKLHTQIKDQSDAFISGFRAMVPTEPLLSFSAPELRRIIAGDDADFDVDDMRKHTQYLGGYHDKHQVIRWFWKIVKDFDSDDKKALLKFVTSCSKPPLSGFVHLNPPFSIRYVQEGEQNGDGPSLLDSVATFFGRAPRNDSQRLPTSSTCFNLLKLPAYKSKDTLKMKLKAAIHAQAGFELS
eukprot:TRINITY_DN18901_c0_g1::TRINITY_DN18901_c0_g1_i1::g.1463::m.1463 TRINITY_DN18901_c0_g1::TRINITY_DN18901_c0_g1_i1::g.1463  ORF type:complete len:1157 (-),score=190.52,sp/Q08CZ0/UBE3B_XENTR/43.84/9e-136,HECT/PF00632.20/4.3e-79 TRINITY_DN18901_c0_g1_i1:33-3503(-)